MSLLAAVGHHAQAKLISPASSVWVLALYIEIARVRGKFVPPFCSLSMSSALAKYDNFFVKNVSAISSLESSLKYLTWVLPGRFKDADLAAEACQSHYCFECLSCVTICTPFRSIRLAEYHKLVS